MKTAGNYSDIVGSAVSMEHLPETIRLYEHVAVDPTLASEKDRNAELLSLLATHHGNVSEVARQMKKDRKQIQRWIKRFSVDIERFRQE